MRWRDWDGGDWFIVLGLLAPVGISVWAVLLALAAKFIKEML